MTPCRLRFLCGLSPKRPLSFPVHTICLDAYGAILDRRPSPFRHEQHIRGHDLVLSPSIPRHHKRHLRLHLRYHFWQNTTYQAFPKKDRGRFRGRLGMHNHLWLRYDQCVDEVQILYLPRKRTSPSRT